jgi:hypothetical protein
LGTCKQAYKLIGRRSLAAICCKSLSLGELKVCKLCGLPFQALLRCAWFSSFPGRAHALEHLHSGCRRHSTFDSCGILRPETSDLNDTRSTAFGISWSRRVGRYIVSLISPDYIITATHSPTHDIRTIIQPTLTDPIQPQSLPST